MTMTIEKIRENYKEANKAFGFYIQIMNKDRKGYEKAAAEYRKWARELAKADENWGRKMYGDNYENIIKEG